MRIVQDHNNFQVTILYHKMYCISCLTRMISKTGNFALETEGHYFNHRKLHVLPSSHERILSFLVMKMEKEYLKGEMLDVNL